MNYTSSDDWVPAQAGGDAAGGGFDNPDFLSAGLSAGAGFYEGG